MCLLEFIAIVPLNLDIQFGGSDGVLKGYTDGGNGLAARAGAENR